MAEPRRYCARDFTQGPKGIRAAHYDRLREAGVTVENATRIANEAVDKTQRKIDQGVGLDAGRPRQERVLGGSDNPNRNPYRVRFDFEPPDAGIDLDRS